MLRFTQNDMICFTMFGMTRRRGFSVYLFIEVFLKILYKSSVSILSDIGNYTFRYRFLV